MMRTSKLQTGDRQFTHRPQGVREIFRRTLCRMSLPVLTLAAFLLAATPAGADPVSHPKGWGLGLMLGSPTGLTVKQWLGGANAWDLGLGFGGFGIDPGFRLHGDYLWGLAQVLPDTSDLTLDLYLGVGPVVGFWRDGWCSNSDDRNDRYDDCRSDYDYGDGSAFIGGRVPFGIDLRLQKAPVEFGLELAPGVVVSRYDVSGLLDFMLIVRFLF